MKNKNKNKNKFANPLGFEEEIWFLLTEILYHVIIGIVWEYFTFDYIITYRIWNFLPQIWPKKKRRRNIFHFTLLKVLSFVQFSIHKTLNFENLIMNLSNYKTINRSMRVTHKKWISYIILLSCEGIYILENIILQLGW